MSTVTTQPPPRSIARIGKLPGPRTQELVSKNMDAGPQRVRNEHLPQRNLWRGPPKNSGKHLGIERPPAFEAAEEIALAVSR